MQQAVDESRAAPASGAIRIGISGWRYEGWTDVFYPEDLPYRRQLEFASHAFSTIELNGSFYSLQRPESYAQWYGETPADFVFSVKGSRYITHLLRLRDIERPLANFFASGLLNLREKLGPFLWQFPPQFPDDPERFEHFFALLPRDAEQALAVARRRDERMKGRVRLAIDANRPLRHAIEIRHKSFLCEQFIDSLRRHGVALVVADTAGRWPHVEDVTADFLYLRLHGAEELYASGYTEDALDEWAARIRAWASGGQPADARRVSATAPAPRASRDVFCYFDNDVKVRAPFDARRLAEKLGVASKSTLFEFPSTAALERVRPLTPRPDNRWENFWRRSAAARRAERSSSRSRK